MLPSDPFILLSYVNTKLRDEYPSLDELCDSLDESREALEEALSKVGCVYSPEHNAFVTRA